MEHDGSILLPATKYNHEKNNDNDTDDDGDDDTDNNNHSVTDRDTLQ